MGHDPDRFFAESFSDVWVAGLRRLLNERSRLTWNTSPRAPGRTIIVLKEPNGSQSADVIMRAQPRAQLLFLLRGWPRRRRLNARLASRWSLGASQHARRLRVGEARRRDRSGVSVAVADGGRRDRVRRPWRPQARASSTRICSASRRVTSASASPGFAFENMRGRGPRQFHRSATPGAWRENLSRKEQVALEEVLGTKLRELG
jgi:hypothetical protein